MLQIEIELPLILNFPFSIYQLMFTSFFDIYKIFLILDSKIQSLYAQLETQLLDRFRIEIFQHDNLILMVHRANYKSIQNLPSNDADDNRRNIIKYIILKIFASL